MFLRHLEVMLLDGAMGTMLESLGCDCAGPAWSARAVVEEPDRVRGLHEAYVAAGAEVVTACTFRTTRRVLGSGWEEVARRAVALAREAAGAGRGVRVAGSIAPLEDCWRPDRSPGLVSQAEHALLARVLVESGCDLLLCETMSNADEAVAATRAGVETGLETWASLTPGYRGDLMTPDELALAGRRVADAGAAAVLVNCVPLGRSFAYVQALRAAVPRELPIGCYANAGLAAAAAASVQTYARAAGEWVAAGARIVGGCCGTSPEHIAAMADLLGKGRGGIRTHE